MATSFSRTWRIEPDAAHAVAHFDRADASFRPVAIDVYVARTPLGVEAEVDRNVVEQGDHLLFVHDARNDGAVFERVERYGAVHGSRVDEDISRLAAMVLAKVLLPHEENPSMAMMIFRLEHSMGG